MAEEQTSTTGIVHLLSSWPQVARTLTFTAVFFILLFGGITLSLYVFKSSGLTIKSTSTGTSIQFSEFDTKIRFDTLLIHPRDWNDPAIKVKKGDKISISALGSVNVAAGLLNQSLATQYMHRQKNESDGIGRDVGLMTELQIHDSQLIVPWNGPEGFRSSSITKNNVKKTHDKESENRIIPHEKIGQLVIAVVSTGSCPTKGETRNSFQLVPYHKNLQFIAEFDGNICFVVNDQYSQDHQVNQLFWDDNLGFFAVNLKIESN